jgi:hypothetical protein
MKLSDILNLISAIITFVLILFIIGRVKNTICFNWFDYFAMFGTLFGNIGINILASIGR